MNNFRVRALAHELVVVAPLPREYRGDSVGPSESKEGRRQRRAAEQMEDKVVGAITRALSAWEPLEGGGEALLRDLAQSLHLSAAVLWLPQDDALFVGATWIAEGADRSALETMVRNGRLPRGSGLAGAAWERMEPLYQTTAIAQEASPGGPWALVAVAARTSDGVLGVVELFLPFRRQVRPILPSMNAAGYLLGRLLARWQAQQEQSKLTTRELELLTLASHGLTNAAIADQLWLSPWTVKKHFEHIRRKLGVSDRTAAVAHGLRSGMIG